MKNKYMEILFFTVLIVIIGCSKKELDNNEEIISSTIENTITDNSFQEEVEESDLHNKEYTTLVIDYDIGYFDFPHGNDDDMVANIKIIYKSESDTILNNSEIEPSSIITEILDKPIMNNEISIISEYDNIRYFNSIIDIMELLNINISPEDVNKINNASPYSKIKIETENITLYVYRLFDTKMKLFLLEYTNSNSFYNFSIQIGTHRNEIIEYLGKPSYYSDKRNIIIYSSNKTLRQINIIFKDDVVEKVQLISFGDI